MDHSQGKCFRGRAIALILFALLGILTGCTRFTDTISLPPEAIEYALYGTRTIGQTFVCHHAGLNAISVLLRAPAGAGDLTLHLRQDTDDTEDLATVSVSPVPGELHTFHEFVLPLQDNVNGKSFFVLLEAPDATANAPVVVPYLLDASLPYSLSLGDGVPSPGHVSFQLTYNSLSIVKDVLRQVSSFGWESLWLLFLSALFYLLPGGAAVVWLLRNGDWIERTIVALGLSVAIYALLMYATMAGLRLDTTVVTGFLVLCGVLIAVRWALDRRSGRFRAIAARDVWMALKGDPSLAVLAWIVMLVMGVRIWITRDMVAPRWGDSYQHTVIAQLMIDHGGVFESWEPYTPYTGLTTHFGFPANVAAFHWFSGIGAIRSSIWVGQILNAMAALGLYPLGKRIAGRWGGTLAVLVSGLLTTTPMVYVNWGRYPQLMGQVLLPVTAWMLWQFLDRPRFDGRLLVLNVVAAVGQFFGYYRMPYYFAILVGAVVLCVYLPMLRLQWKRWSRLLLWILAVGVLSGILLLPWALHIAGAHLVTAFDASAPGGNRIGRVLSEYQVWRSIGSLVPLPVLVMAGGSFLCALVWWSAPAVAIGVWGIGLFGITATQLIGVPAAAYMTPFSSAIFMYAPVSLLSGWGGARLVSWLSNVGGRKARPLYIAALALLALFGAYRMSTVSDPSHALVEPVDLEAMAWIREHTPQDARFLVNGFCIYEGTSIVGSDAGWWIPLLAERENTMPPQYALFAEKEAVPGYGRRLVELVAGLRETPLSSPEGLTLVCKEGITHVYVGQGEGRVAKPAAEPLFTAQEMRSSPAFEALYHQDNVWVFALADVACEP